MVANYTFRNTKFDDPTGARASANFYGMNDRFGGQGPDNVKPTGVEHENKMLDPSIEKEHRAALNNQASIFTDISNFPRPKDVYKATFKEFNGQRIDTIEVLLKQLGDMRESNKKALDNGNISQGLFDANMARITEMQRATYDALGQNPFIKEQMRVQNKNGFFSTPEQRYAAYDSVKDKAKGEENKSLAQRAKKGVQWTYERIENRFKFLSEGLGTIQSLNERGKKIGAGLDPDKDMDLGSVIEAFVGIGKIGIEEARKNLTNLGMFSKDQSPEDKISASLKDFLRENYSTGKN